jgi:hypothetical protein
MGIAAYNRGVNVTVNQIRDDAEQASHLDRINSMRRGTGKPFGPVVIVPPQTTGDTLAGQRWWLMQAGADRHSHYAYCYDSLFELMADWSLYVTGHAADSAGSYYTTIPL